MTAANKFVESSLRLEIAAERRRYTKFDFETVHLRSAQ